MKKRITIITALFCAVSCLFAETDPVAMKAIKALRYGSNDKYNLVSPKVSTSITVPQINADATSGTVIIDGVTIQDGQVSSTNSTGVKTDVVAEKTAGTGVTVDGVLLKDGAITPTGTISTISGSVTDPALLIGTNGLYLVSAIQVGMSVGDTLSAWWTSSGMNIGAIDEAIVGVGVTIDGVLCKDGQLSTTNTIGLKTDAISEKTGATGVTIDSVKLKDGGITVANGQIVSGGSVVAAGWTNLPNSSGTNAIWITLNAGTNSYVIPGFLQ